MLIDLAVTPFSDVLRRASAERWGGDLQVRSKRTTKTLFLDRGHLVFAASNLKQDRLGEALVALGRISPGDFERASALMSQRDRRRRFGEALVQAGVMDAKELGRSVARQVARIVLSLFPLSDGAVSFEDRPCAIPLEYMVSLSVHRLLYQGIKAMRNGHLIRAGLGDLDRVVCLTSVSPFRLALQKCSSDEVDIMQRCKERATFRELVEVEGGLSVKRLRATYALHASGILEAVDPAGSRARPVVTADTGSFVLSPLQRQPEPSEHETLRKEVSLELARSGALDEAQWLRESRQAHGTALINAIEDKIERYQGLLEVAGDDAKLRTSIELILGRASRQLYLGRQEAAEAPSPGPAKGPPPAAPGGRARPAATPAPKGTAAEPAASGGGDAELTLLRMEAEARVAVSDFANAVGCYAKMVSLQPTVASHRVELATAMARWPRTARKAEREFQEALRLEPNDPEIHYKLGLFYKAMKLKARAVQQLRAAVRLDPRHEPARRELKALAPKDSALSSLKSLFT
jgi:tetratricopeptide (TPR) repeat protein